MGQLKPLLDWFGVPLVVSQIASLFTAGVDEIYVVTGHRAYEVQETFNDTEAESVINPHYREGKSTSVKAGLASIPADTDAILLLAVDQPRPAWLVRSVLDQHEAKRPLITSPRFEGRGGHPLIFDSSLTLELDRISEDTRGVRQVIREHSSDILWIDFDTPLVRLDMNTPDTYEAAKSTYATYAEPAGPA
jgi:CTP:molybdopterin cytidylyltransferase MocA